jgi:thioredoxin-like negative regulator of GroEL
MLRGAPSGEIAQPRGDAPPVSRVEALLSLADIAARQGDAARSAEFIDTAFSHANDAPGEQTLLEQGLRRRSNHELLARTLEGRLQLALSGAAIPLLAELADLYQHHLGRPADALEARLRTTRLAPASVELREAALGLARELGQIRVFAESLARLAASDLLPGETRFELWLAVARLREADLGDLRLAVVAYEEAEMLAPPAPDPAPALRRVWAQLQSVFERLGDLPALAALLERRASFESDSDSNPVLQARPVYALAELLLASPATVEQGVDKLELAMLLDPQVERVSGLFERVVAQQPDSERLLRAHVRFCREQNLLPQLIKALVQLGELPDGGTPPLREAATLSISSGDDRGADAILRQITELDQLPGALPDVIWALLTLADRLEGSGDPALSASLRERAAELSEPAERRGLLLEVVRLCRGPLHDLPRAARTLAVLHDAEPGDPALWQPLADLYRQIGDEVRLATLIEALLPIVDEKLRQTLRRELAGLWLRERPGQNTSLLHQAVRVLQDILLDDPADAEASTQLASLLERLGDRDLLARHLEQQIESAKDRSDGALLAALSLRLGALREQQNQPRAAVDAYRSGLDWAPESRDLLRAILRLVDRDGDAFEATELMEKLLPLESGPEASALALRLAALHDESWNHELAEKAIEAGYRIFPSTELRDQLITRYTEASRWAELAALLERDSASRATTPERASALRRAAEIQQKQLSNPVEAARLYELALALTPADRPVLLALLGVLAARPAGASSRRAVEALGHALEKTPHDPELLRLRAEQLFALGEHDAALADLDLALAHRGDLPAATALLEQALTRAAGQAQRTLRLRLAMLLLRAAQFDAARGHLDALLRLEPAHPEGLRALAALERAAGRPEAVIIPLRSLVTTIDGQALIPVALDLADLCEAARKPHDARAALERALRIAPDNVDLSRRLRRLYEQIGARRELAALLREDAARATESGPRFEALLGAARLLLDPQQGDLKLAAQLLDEARTLRPDDIDLALTLADAQVALKRPREAIALLSQLVNAHRGRRSRHLAQAYQKRAQLELASGDHVAGLASLSKAFESDGSNGLLAMEMGRLALELNDEQAASRAFRAITLMKVAPTATEEGTTIAAKAQAYYQLSLLALGQNDRRKARLLAEKAVSEDPSLEPARQLRDELKNG